VREFKTRAMTIVLRLDNIVELINNKDWEQPDTMEIAIENMAMVKKVIDGESRGFLVEVPNKYTTRELLNYYQNIEVGDIARALVLNSFAAKVVGNLYFKISGGKLNEVGRIVPVKLFTDKEAAVKWLLEKMEEHKN
jgi:hypothetical protein